jgi:hypothetical protein
MEGVDVNYPDNMGWKPIHFAVFYHNKKAVDALLGHKRMKENPSSVNESLRETFLKNGQFVDTKVLTNDGENIYDLACSGVGVNIFNQEKTDTTMDTSDTRAASLTGELKRPAEDDSADQPARKVMRRLAEDYGTVQERDTNDDPLYIFPMGMFLAFRAIDSFKLMQNAPDPKQFFTKNIHVPSLSKATIRSLTKLSEGYEDRARSLNINSDFLDMDPYDQFLWLIKTNSSEREKCDEWMNIVISNAYDKKFNGEYKWYKSSNGHTHWRSKRGAHIYFGKNSRWILARSYAIESPEVGSAVSKERSLYIGNNQFTWNIVKDGKIIYVDDLLLINQDEESLCCEESPL